MLNGLSEWTGLVPFIPKQFPSNLLISSDITERFSDIFQFVFPLKCQKFILREIFINTNQLLKLGFSKNLTYKVSVLRNLLEIFINSTLEYIYLDLFIPAWEKFDLMRKNPEDFDDLRKELLKFLDTLHKGLFWNLPKVGSFFKKLINNVQILRQVVDDAFQFPIQETNQRLYQLHEIVHQNINQLVVILYYIVDSGEAEHASKLLTKINFNDHFSDIIKDNLD